MALHDPALRELYDLKVCDAFSCISRSVLIKSKVFVQCDSDLMLARRIKRDVEHRGRTVDGILDQYVLNSQSALLFHHHWKISALCQTII